MIVSLYTSRVILNVLGVEDFGIYNVVGGVVTMFGFLNGAMASATQRFLSIELGKKDIIRLKKIFNATQVIHFGIAILVLVLAESIGKWVFNMYLNISIERINSARWVYQFAVLSLMISIIQVPYNSVILAREKMSVYAYISIIDVLLKLLVVFLLKLITIDKLKLYGLLLCSVSFIIALIFRLYSKRQFEETRFQLVKDKFLYKTLINYSWWNLFGVIASISKSQGVIVILNIFFGTVVNAAQGVANQVSGAINMFVSNFQIASNPQIIKSYAINDKEYMNNLIIRTAKFSFYLIFILTLPIILEIDYILKLWLKIVPGYTAIFTVLILISAIIDAFSGPLMTALQATGKIRKYQIIVGLLLFSILPISYTCFRFGLPPYSTFIVGICISIVALVFRLLLTKDQIPEFSISYFLKELIFRNIPIVILSCIVPIIIKYNMQVGIIRLFVVAFTSILSSMVLIYVLGLGNNEKIFIKNSIHSFKIK
jgi:O-antigen/teichoic acid export membrane protein